MERERKMAKERKKTSGQRWKEEKKGRREIESEPPPAIKPPSGKQACCLIRVTPSEREGGRKGREGKCFKRQAEGMKRGRERKRRG